MLNRLGQFSDVFLKFFSGQDLESFAGHGGDLDVGLVQLLLHDLLQDRHRLADRLLQRHRAEVRLLQKKRSTLVNSFG